MEQATYFVDVILPLSIPNLLTYRVPRELSEHIKVGQRVVVQLGKKKLYTAIVRSIHETAPENYTAKYVETILDEHPVVNEKQLKLWEWMAAYYVCHIGEVMSAALPSSMKLASETKVVFNDMWDGELDHLNDKEMLVVNALQIQEVLELQDIADILQVKNVQPYVKGLFDKGVILTEEELAERYKPKVVEFLKLHPRLHDDEALQEVFDTLEKRAYKQLEFLMAFFHETGNDEHDQREVAKLELQKKTGGNSSLTNKLVEKEILTLEERQIGRIEDFSGETIPQVELNEDQSRALTEVAELWEEKEVVLLHGVTGSGKTEVYVKLIHQVIAQGKQALYLLPEIALTTQIINRLKRYFGDRVGVYHSKFNQNERVEIWRDVLAHHRGKYDVILGARSASLLPFSNLGLVIVDEEHETSYKQFDPAPRYQARDLAMVLARVHGAKTLLGSATPSIESYWNAKQGHFGLVEMTRRFGNIQMPEIQCADMRKELKEKRMKGVFTEMLLEHIREALKNKEQIILFQNRRGYSPIWQCHMCGDIPQCKSCDVSLTYHKASHQLKCHYCGYAKTPPSTCGVCGSNDLRMLGMGTEKIEEEIAIHFPDIRVQRMDLDTTRSKNAYQRIITEFENREVDILVGTQMVTKGLDFDNVSLVGVLNADQMINFPDFRSFERAFHLMAQVAGRAGRKRKRGKVIIQTNNPTHWLLPMVMDGDYEGLYRHEEIERRKFLYPPFYRLIKLTLKHKESDKVYQASEELAKRLFERLGQRVIGPETPYISRIRNQFLRNILIKIERESSPAAAKEIITEKINELKQGEFKGVRVVVDVDPS